MQGLALLALTSLAVFLQTLGRHVAQAGSGKLPHIRGIPLSKLSLYSPDKDFECLDGSLIIPYTRVNDDYCDCADGSDEPGTPACTDGFFYCQNSGICHCFLVDRCWFHRVHFSFFLSWAEFFILQLCTWLNFVIAF